MLDCIFQLYLYLINTNIMILTFLAAMSCSLLSKSLPSLLSISYIRRFYLHATVFMYLSTSFRHLDFGLPLLLKTYHCFILFLYHQLLFYVYCLIRNSISQRYAKYFWAFISFCHSSKFKFQDRPNPIIFTISCTFLPFGIITCPKYSKFSTSLSFCAPNFC